MVMTYVLILTCDTLTSDYLLVMLAENHQSLYKLNCLTYCYVSLSCGGLGSLGTRPSKNRKGGSGTLAGVEVYTSEC